jgi:hypothetical protein
MEAERRRREEEEEAERERELLLQQETERRLREEQEKRLQLMRDQMLLEVEAKARKPSFLARTSSLSAAQALICSLMIRRPRTGAAGRAQENARGSGLFEW